MATLSRRALSAPIAWRERELVSVDGWRYTFDDADRAELEGALRALPDAGLDAITPANFPLPGLKTRLEESAQALRTGAGVVKWRGFPVAGYGEAELKRLFTGVSSYLGQVTDQNGRRGMIREIRDTSAKGGQRVDSAQGLNWHNDRTDRVGLLCVREAASGGLSRVVSGVTIHNAMLETCPELLDVLFRDYNRYAPGDEIGNTAGVYARPVFAVSDGQLSIHYSGTYIRQAVSLRGAPALSVAQRAALDKLVEFAEAFAYDMRLQPGEIQFLNNHAMLHGRSPFSDQPGPEAGRLLYRIWLATPGSAAWTA